MSSPYNTANKKDWCKPEPMQTAVVENDMTLLKALIDAKVDTETRNKIDWTPLQYAANAGNSEAVRLLLDAGANPNALKDGTEDGALSLAAEKGDVEIMQMLLDKGAKIDQQNSFDETALMIAAHWQQPESVAFLIEQGAALDLQSRDGNTALMIAANNASDQVAYHLLRAGAQTHFKNEQGKTAHDIASKRSKQHESARKILGHLKDITRDRKQNSLRRYLRGKGPGR